jgi:hypothetical protein
MVGRFAGLGVAAIAGSMLAACVIEQAVEGPTYQAPVAQVPPPANLPGVCFTEQDMRTVQARMTQQVLATGTLGCKSADGTRQYHQHYTNFIGKFQNDLKANYQDLSALVARKRLNMDTMVTEMANRTAGRANEPDFCSRLGRAYQWALSAKVTQLTQVPSPYDFSPEMRVFRCPASTG